MLLNKSKDIKETTGEVATKTGKWFGRKES